MREKYSSLEFEKEMDLLRRRNPVLLLFLYYATHTLKIKKKNLAEVLMKSILFLKPWSEDLILNRMSLLYLFHSARTIGVKRMLLQEKEFWKNINTSEREFWHPYCEKTCLHPIHDKSAIDLDLVESQTRKVLFLGFLVLRLTKKASDRNKGAT